ncbi:MAG TPA: glycosyltransferase [Chryseolinea sp.]|nr:glycosyltransferase [Chryseolinea sp.]
MATPLVSCIMPTCNRRAFVPQAIRNFLRQDYENKELVIVDDGSDCIKDLVPDNSQIRYIQLSKKMTLGEKRNYCVRESRGDLIMHWDDDDWMAPYRISYQLSELIKNDVEICGLQQMFFFEIEAEKGWLYKYPSHAKPWLAGGSLLYTKNFWKKAPFPNMQVASDTQFIFSRKLESFLALSDHHFYVAAIHDSNTSSKKTGSNLWFPIDASVIKKTVGDNWPIYSNGNKKAQSNESVRSNNGVVKEDAVSACLLSYKRARNIQKIVDSIQNYPFIDEILIWNNNSEERLDIRGDKVKIIASKENTICYGRFLCAKEARNEIIYFQDDDVIVENVRELYHEFLKDSSRITHRLSTNHYKIRDKYRFFSGNIAFLGWGSFVKKSWISVLDDYLKENQDDYLFRREADKVFTLISRRQNNTLPAGIRLLENDSTPGIALYLETQHYFYAAQAIRKALEFNRTSKTFFPVTWNVVIPCMNYGNYLEEAVRSVLLNHADYIITIVDDCSSDNTEAVCMNLIQQFPFIHYLRNEKRMGTGFTRNRGIAFRESLFVVLLDADDKIGPEYLFEAEKLLRKGFDVVNPDAILFGDVNSRWPVPETVTLPMQLQRNHVHCCSAFRRSYWVQVEGIDEKMFGWEDYDFWIRLAEAGARIKKINGDHFYYRKHGPSRSVSEQHDETLRLYIREKNNHLFQNR